MFLYGELSGTGADGTPGRTRSQLRRGGVAGLAARLAAGEDRLAPDFGPARMHPRGGATLVAARPPLVAFNLQLAAPATVVEARAIAAQIREGGTGGLPGVRAIGLTVNGGVAQVSMNIERRSSCRSHASSTPFEATPRSPAPSSSGWRPRAAFDGFPEDVPMPGFDPARHLIENALGC